MRFISSAQLASAARLALIEGRLGAPKGSVAWRDDENCLVCAIGSALSLHEVDLLTEHCNVRFAEQLDGPTLRRIGVDIERIGYARALANAHDAWATIVFAEGADHDIAAARAEFLRLLDLRDPVKRLAELPALPESVKELA